MNQRAYNYWYEFLKRSEKYKECCSNGGKGELSALYLDFGDVHVLSWSKWWKAYKELFSSEEPLFVINEVKTNAEFTNWFEEGADDLLALIINLAAPKDAIIKKIDMVLQRLNKKKLKKENELRIKANPKASTKKKQGRPKFDPSFYHRYGLTPVPSSRDIEALGIMLKVYDACRREDAKQKGDRRKKRYEIGEELGIILTPTQKTIKDRIVSSEEYRNSMTATVSRYYRWAKEIIENTEQGIFPKHS